MDIKELINTPHKKKEKWLNENYPNIYQEIKNKYHNNDWKESVYMYCYDIQNAPKCKTCDNDVKFLNFTDGFKIYCSKGCISRDPDIKKQKAEKLKKTLNIENFKTEEDIKIQKAEWYQKNKEKVKEQKKLNKERDRKNVKRWLEENKEHSDKYFKKYYLDNKEKILKDSAEYYKKNKIKMRSRKNEYQKKRKKEDPLFHLSHNIRILILKSIQKGGYSKKSKTSEILGCTFEEFKIHLEEKFTEGMNWGNNIWITENLYHLHKTKKKYMN